MQAVIIFDRFGATAAPFADATALLTPLLTKQMRVLAKEGVRSLTIYGPPDAWVPAMAEARSLGLAVQKIGERTTDVDGDTRSFIRGDEPALIVAGNVLFDISMAPLCSFHRSSGACLTVVAQSCLDPWRSDLVRERGGYVAAYVSREQRRHDERNLAPTGIYLAAPGFFSRPVWRGGETVMRDAVPALLAAGASLGCYRTVEYVRALDSPDQCAAAAADLAEGRGETLRGDHKRPAIIFDCDGVLNEERPPKGVLQPDQIELIRGAANAVRRARAAGYLTIAITNRAQVARGEITFEELDRILGRLEALLAAEGGLLDRIYVCPHHPAPGRPTAVRELSIACECRKPGSLLFRRALAELPIDPIRSFAIGDSLRDIGAARAVGLPALGVRTGYGCTDIGRYPGGASAAPTPDQLFADVGSAVDYILSRPR